MLARIFEAVVWYETGMFATQLVDPVTLSYKKLKTILEGRGLGYSGLAEKKDVSDLVEKSGTVCFSLMRARPRIRHTGTCARDPLVGPSPYVENPHQI